MLQNSNPCASLNPGAHGWYRFALNAPMVRSLPALAICHLWQSIREDSARLIALALELILAKSAVDVQVIIITKQISATDQFLSNIRGKRSSSETMGPYVLTNSVEAAGWSTAHKSRLFANSFYLSALFRQVYK